MTDLADLVPGLQYALAIPGTFDTSFPLTSEDDLTAVLLDAFGETQLNSFFSAYSADENGIVTPDLTRAEAALILLYATVRVLRTELRNRKTHVRYEAAGVVYEVDQSANLLVALLKTYEDEKKLVTAAGASSGAGSAFYMADQYFQRALAGSVFDYSETYGW